MTTEGAPALSRGPCGFGRFHPGRALVVTRGRRLERIEQSTSGSLLLFARHLRAARSNRELRQREGRRIGMTWRGEDDGHTRSVALPALLRLTASPDLRRRYEG
jgi:hypothetical protein